MAGKHNTIKAVDERLAELAKMGRIAGVDEAGRGPLVGSVFAAAVVLPKDYVNHEIRDSKKLSEARREKIALDIKRDALAWSVASSSPEVIEDLNILGATMRAMGEALRNLDPSLYDVVMVDGNRLPGDLPQGKEAYSLVKGDSLLLAISAASILAKTARDEEMRRLDAIWPEYGFKDHKGYGTKRHLEAIAEHGYLREHRVGFAPINGYVAQGLKPRN